MASSTSKPHPSSSSLTRTSRITTRLFAYSRIILGAASVLVPHFTCSLFQFQISNETATVVRLFGVRGIALGSLLMASLDEKMVWRKVLRANVGCDVIDIGSLAFAVMSGHLDLMPGMFLAGGAASLVCLGGWGLGSS
ncbi:unnamed protein product [Periconia digitata]|uniref:Uncharacterized protein n=1 Tax=Periconia digitata TaxID=1303443 RepID=A0A9W4XQ70_9PLEO|nr:unnamed protein product [Periconia digitata]